MSLYRWEQIHRHMTFSTNSIAYPQQRSDRTPKDPPWWKLEPVLSTIRENCQRAVTPASWVSVDEVMVSYRGRTSHTLKIKNKPIGEGYKVWSSGFDGYYYS